MSFFEEVYAVCKKIPKGKVATYGQIAGLIGHPKAGRQVGWAMSSCTDKEVPWHRVINRMGKLHQSSDFGNIQIQKQLLEEEGIEVSDEYIVDLKKYLWEK